MPELPEVQTVVSSLAPRVVGGLIRRVRVLRGDIIEPPGTDLVSLLQGRRVKGIERRGKKIVFTIDSGERFIIHLGMSGRLTAQNSQDGLAPHTHLILEMEKELEMRFSDPRRFGGVWWLGKEGAVDEGMGPEPLELTARELAARLAGTRRAIKTTLLDQTVIAGLGNIYADEALFAAGIHPLTPTDRLERGQVAALNRAIKATLKRALRHKGSTLRDYRDADGKRGEFQKLHRVYDRAGKACANCGTAIVRQVIGGRSAHFCPHCQPRKPQRPGGRSRIEH